MAEAVDVGSGQAPLKGVVLCCTSLAQDARTQVQDVAPQMGAVHRLDLTGDVTHLLVGSITTPKYQYVAKERPDICVLRPQWLEGVRKAWMDGDDHVDLAALDEQFRLPTFFGLRICVTGFDDAEHRSFLSETIVQQGAEYQGDLTKQITHLIAAAPQGAKYHAAKAWGVKIVSLRWFEDSLRRGMALDESLYDPVVPVDEQGKGAFRTVVKQRTSLGKRSRADDELAAATGEAGKRKLRRTASTRLNSESQDLWQDLSARDDDSVTLADDQWKDNHAQQDPSVERTEAQRSDIHPASDADPAPPGLFTGIHILIHDSFDKGKVAKLRHYLDPNGATVVPSLATLETASHDPSHRSSYLLVPHAPPEWAPLQLPSVPAGAHFVTEWWLERCILFKRVMNPTEDPLSLPFWNVRIPAFSQLTMTTTGLTGLDFRQTALAIPLLGAVYAEKMSPQLSVVLVSTTRVVKPEKAYYATKHDIPVVTVDWLWACLKLREKVPFEGFRVRAPTQDVEQSLREQGPSNLGTSGNDLVKRQTEGDGRETGMVKGGSEAPATRLSNTRKRYGTPSLALQAVGPSSTTTATTTITTTITTTKRSKAPFVHEDADYNADSLPLPIEPLSRPAAPHPLRELSPNKPSQEPLQSGTKNLMLKAPFIHEDSDHDAGRLDSLTLPALPPLRPERETHALHEESPNKLSQETLEGERAAETLPVPAAAAINRPSPIKASIEDRPAQALSKPPQEDPATVLQALMQNQRRRQASLGSDGVGGGEVGLSRQRRTGRKLGRNLSGTSNLSASASTASDNGNENRNSNNVRDGSNCRSNSNTSIAIPPKANSSSASFLPHHQVDSADSAAADGFPSITNTKADVLPSTQLGYETAAAEAHRAQMSALIGLGSGLGEDGEQGRKRVAKVGVVKDGGLSGRREGVEGRLRARVKR